MRGRQIGRKKPHPYTEECGPYTLYYIKDLFGPYTLYYIKDLFLRSLGQRSNQEIVELRYCWDISTFVR